MEEVTQNDQLKRARKVALVLATACVTCVLLLVYIQVKRLESERYRTMAERIGKELENQRVMAEQNEKIAKANERAALQALEECQMKNK